MSGFRSERQGKGRAKWFIQIGKEYEQGEAKTLNPKLVRTGELKDGTDD
jgi:hypothetical protein